MPPDATRRAGAEVPPATGFLGDWIEVVCEPAPTSVRFVATGTNAMGVVTELLAQKLKTLQRTPVLKEYRSQRFVAFAPGGLEAEVAVGTGVWACAVRFVRQATGQETAVVPLGIVEIGA